MIYNATLKLILKSNGNEINMLPRSKNNIITILKAMILLIQCVRTHNLRRMNLSGNFSMITSTLNCRNNINTTILTSALNRAFITFYTISNQYNVTEFLRYLTNTIKCYW